MLPRSLLSKRVVFGDALFLDLEEYKNDVVTLLHVLARKIMMSLVNKTHELTSLKMLTQF